MKRNHSNIIKLVLLNVVLLSCSTTNYRIQRVENGLSTEWKTPFYGKMNLTERMDYYRIPGVSIAVIDNFQLEWAKGYGVLESGSDNPVTTNTLFQTASIGKPVVAATALHFVDLGKLELDENVNNKLISWKVPENSFTRRTPVTLRMLLSHTAGVTLPGVIGYKQGEEQPGLIQILKGESPANTPPINVDRVPGTKYRYSGGGYLIVQQMLIDLYNSSKTFPEIVEETVFNPIKMSESYFGEVPVEKIKRTATAHRYDGNPISGKWYNYPETGMGVFWTTPTDMTKFISEIMLAYNGRSEKIISTEMTRITLSPQIEKQGLGFPIDDDGKDRFYFFHKGATEGYQTFIVGYPKRGQGAVIMTNSDNGQKLIDEIVKSLSITYNWIGGIHS